jgi:hypothetical protein
MNSGLCVTCVSHVVNATHRTHRTHHSLGGLPLQDGGDRAAHARRCTGAQPKLKADAACKLKPRASIPTLIKTEKQEARPTSRKKPPAKRLCREADEEMRGGLPVPCKKRGREEQGKLTPAKLPEISEQNVQLTDSALSSSRTPRARAQIQVGWHVPQASTSLRT